MSIGSHFESSRLISSTTSLLGPGAYGSIASQENSAITKPETNDESIITLFKKMTWRKRITAITAALVNFSSLACFAIMAPFLPIEAVQKGIDPTAVGMIFACFELVMFVASITFGRYISAIGARFMYISGVFIASTCAILFGMLQWCPPGTPFLTMAILCRLVEALGCAMSQTASTAILAAEFPDRIATVMGTLETFAGIGLMAGPPIGGALYELGGFYLPFVVIGVFFFCTGIVAYLILPGTIVTQPKDRAALFRKFIKVPGIWVCGICIATCANMITFLDPTLSNHLASIDPTVASSGALIGLIFLVEPSIYAILSPFIGYLSDKSKQPIFLLFIGNVGFIFTYLLLGPSPWLPFLPPKQLWLTILALVFLGLFISFCFMPSFAVMNIECVSCGMPNDLDLYGLIGGFFASAFNLGAFFGPILGGILVQYFDFETASSIVALTPILDLTVLTSYALFLYHKGRS